MMSSLILCHLSSTLTALFLLLSVSNTVSIALYILLQKQSQLSAKDTIQCLVSTIESYSSHRNHQDWYPPRQAGNSWWRCCWNFRRKGQKAVGNAETRVPWSAGVLFPRYEEAHLPCQCQLKPQVRKKGLLLNQSIAMWKIQELKRWTLHLLCLIYPISTVKRVTHKVHEML